MIGQFCAALLAFVLLATAPTAAAAAAREAIASPAFAHARALEESQLDAERGGLRLPNGLVIDFAVVARSVVDGRLALETELVWTDAGAVMTRRALDGGVETSAPGLSTATLPGVGGETTLMHRFEDGRLHTIALNSASDRVVTQSLDLTLTLPGFAVTQQEFGFARAALRIAEDLALAGRVGAP